MQATTPAYRDAIEQAEALPVARVLADWDRGGAAAGDERDDMSRYLASVTVDRSLSSDLPDTATLVAGYAAATASVELTGEPGDEARHAAWLFSPYNPASPFHGADPEGAPVRVELGYRTPAGDELLPALSGHGDELALRVGERAATLDVLDGVERLRRAVELPMIVGSDPNVIGLDGGLNSQWVVDHVARQGGFHSCPPPRPACVLSATLHGSFAAEVGQLATVSYLADDGDGDFTSAGGTVPYTPGRFALAPAPRPNTTYSALYHLDRPASQAVGSAVLFAGWVFLPDQPSALDRPDIDWVIGDLAETNVIRYQVTRDGDHARPQIGVSRPGGSFTHSPNLPITTEAWHYLGVHLRFATATDIEVELRVDAVSTREDTTLPAQTVAPAMAIGGIGATARCEAVQVSTEPAPAHWDDTFEPTAVLEPGLNELTAIPATSAPDAWALLGQIAAAEYATIHLDESGVLRFWNRHHWHTAPAATQVQRTLTAAQPITGLSITRQAARVRNRITVAASPLHVAPLGVVWTASGDPVTIPARSTVEVWTEFAPDMVYDLRTDTGIIPPGGAVVNMRSGYRAARAKDGTGGELRNLVMTVTAFATRARIVVRNPNPFAVWLVSPRNAGYPVSSDGNPALALVGRRISTAAPDLDSTEPADPSRSTTVRVEASWPPSIQRFGERVLTVEPSPWRQRVEDAQSLADDLLDALYLPVPQLGPVDIVADPAIQLGDRVQLHDPATGLDDPFWVVGITTTFQEDGMTQTVTLRPVARPGQWIIGVPGRTEIGLTTVV